MWHNKFFTNKTNKELKTWKYSKRNQDGHDYLYDLTSWTIFSMYWPQISFYALIGKE